MDNELLKQVTIICQQAAQKILPFYHDEQAMNVHIKEDNSPVTNADLAAHEIIVKQLQKLDGSIPVLSEESAEVDWQVRKQWQRYWLIDPLDGTKEFINHSDEFTVNIALIEKGKPALGVVHVPVSGVTYTGMQGVGATKQLGNESPVIIHTETVKQRVNGSLPFRVVSSLRHNNELTEQLLNVLQRYIGTIEKLSMGSSLKFCLLAEGLAECYPRFAPTSEWDTAAAHAVLACAGGEVVNTYLQPLCYNSKESLLNPSFLAIGDKEFPWNDIMESIEY